MLNRYQASGSITVVSDGRKKTINLNCGVYAPNWRKAIEDVSSFLHIPVGEAARLVDRRPVPFECNPVHNEIPMAAE